MTRQTKQPEDMKTKKHGACCYCQTCNKDHDECNCDFDKSMQKTINLCKSCNCMTKTLDDGRCGKCGFVDRFSGAKTKSPVRKSRTTEDMKTRECPYKVADKYKDDWVVSKIYEHDKHWDLDLMKDGRPDTGYARVMKNKTNTREWEDRFSKLFYGFKIRPMRTFIKKVEDTTRKETIEEFKANAVDEDGNPIKIYYS